MKYLNNNEQICFSKGKRTSDHIFVLNTLIDKYCKQGSKRLFSCFVDFRRAFYAVYLNNFEAPLRFQRVK
jgi:hypothetical protein